MSIIGRASTIKKLATAASITPDSVVPTDDQILHEADGSEPGFSFWKRAVICIVAVIVAHVIQLFVLQHAEQTALEAGTHQAEVTVAGTEVWLRRTLEDAEYCLDLLQQRQVLIDEQDPRAGEIEAILVDIAAKRRFDVVAAITIEPNGLSNFSTWRSAMGVNEARRPSVRAVGPDPDRIYVSDAFFGELTHRWLVAFTRHLKHADGSDAGAGSVTLDAMGLSQHLVGMMTQEAQSVAIWRDGGDAVTLTGWGRGLASPPSSPPAVFTGEMASKDSADFIMRSDILKADVITSAKRLPDLGLIVAAHINIADVLAKVDDVAARLIWVKDAVVGLFALAVVLWHRQHVARQRVASTLADVTKKAYRIAAVQAEIDRAMDILPGAIYRARLYPDGRSALRFVSRSVERLAGWPSAMLVEMPGGLDDICEIDDAAEFRSAIYAKQLSDALVSFDARLRRPDESARWVRFSQQTVMQADGFLEVVGLITDIETERASAAAAIASARLVTLGEMASGMAHEISQPLAMMSLAAENAIIALQRNGTEAAIARMERIPVQAQRAQSIINHLRLFARQQQGRHEAVVVQDTINGALLLVEGALRDDSVTLSINIQANLPPVCAEQVMLEQVLVNLVLNARDAMTATPVAARRVEISANLVRGQVEIAVQDTGSGIPEHVMPRLFEPFFTTKPPGMGTGLGLSICHGIVRSFNGTIQARNTTIGSRFAVLLNVASGGGL